MYRFFFQLFFFFFFFFWGGGGGGGDHNLRVVGYLVPVSLQLYYRSVLCLFQPCVILALHRFGPGSFLPYVLGRLIEIVRYILYNRGLWPLTRVEFRIFFT